jgi:hypothetical protein
LKEALHLMEIFISWGSLYTAGDIDAIGKTLGGELAQGFREIIRGETTGEEPRARGGKGS